MARYQVPPDPRDPANKANVDRGLGRLDEGREPIPWMWLGLGILVTGLGLAIAVALANMLLSRPPLPVGDLPPATLIRLTSPPSPVPSTTPLMETPTAIPTFTPVPTPDTAVAPDTITPGFYGVVANTEGFGLTIRGGPSTSNVAITVADEGATLLILAGPEEGDGFLWWEVQLDDGTEGWAAGEFIVPTAAP